MGLFSGKKKKDANGGKLVIEVYPWKTAPITKTYRMPPEKDKTIFTYNGEPFKGMRQGVRFTIAAVPADVRMPSMYTGTVASTKDYGDIAYEFNGQIFGFCSAHAEAIRKLMLAGYRVEVEAYISEYDMQQGYPKIRGMFGFVDDATYRSLQP